MAIENGYIVLDIGLVVDTTERRLMECNAKAVYAIQGGLIGSEFVKVMHCASTREISNKLKNVYEGDGKVKVSKIQTYIR